MWGGGIIFNIKADGTYSYHWSLKTKPETANTKKTIPKNEYHHKYKNNIQ
jgi:hypothetical protein